MFRSCSCFIISSLKFVLANKFFKRITENYQTLLNRVHISVFNLFCNESLKRNPKVKWTYSYIKLGIKFKIKNTACIFNLLFLRS